MCQWVQVSTLNRLRRSDPLQWRQCRTCLKPIDYSPLYQYGGLRGNALSFLLDNIRLVRVLVAVTVAVLVGAPPFHSIRRCLSTDYLSVCVCLFLSLCVSPPSGQLGDARRVLGTPPIDLLHSLEYGEKSVSHSCPVPPPMSCNAMSGRTGINHRGPACIINSLTIPRLILCLSMCVWLYIKHPHWEVVLQLPLLMQLWMAQIFAQFIWKGYMSLESALVMKLVDYETCLIEPLLPVTGQARRETESGYVEEQAA